jgi:hypothetical protein
MNFIFYLSLTAENRFREIQTAKAEGRTIHKNNDALITLVNLS